MPSAKGKEGVWTDGCYFEYVKPAFGQSPPPPEAKAFNFIVASFMIKVDSLFSIAIICSIAS